MRIVKRSESTPEQIGHLKLKYVYKDRIWQFNLIEEEGVFQITVHWTAYPA